MSFSRTRWSAAIAWGMIPLAIWAGLPSTACVCANGQLKLVCRHAAGGSVKDHSIASQSSSDHEDGCHSSCCETHSDIAEVDLDHDADCCSSGSCCHSAASGVSGAGSKACCKPILTAPSVAPELASGPCDQTLAVVSVVDEAGAPASPSLTQDVAELDTGPPLDRVIVFRALLI